MRVGGLNSITQNGFSKDSETFHSPPAKKGIYCFVEGFYESFLLSGSFSKIGQKHSKFKYIKDDQGNPIEAESPIDQYLEQKGYTSNQLSFMYSIDSIGKNKIEEIKTRLNLEIPEDIIEAENKYSELIFNSWTYFHPKKNVHYFVEPLKIKKFYHYGDLWHHLGNHLKPYQILERKDSWVKTSFLDYKKAYKKEYAKIKQPWVQFSNQNFQDKDFWVGRYGRDHMEVFIEKIIETKRKL